MSMARTPKKSRPASKGTKHGRNGKGSRRVDGNRATRAGAARTSSAGLAATPTAGDREAVAKLIQKWWGVSFTSEMRASNSSHKHVNGFPDISLAAQSEAMDAQIAAGNWLGIEAAIRSASASLATLCGEMARINHRVLQRRGTHS